MFIDNLRTAPKNFNRKTLIVITIIIWIVFNAPFLFRMSEFEEELL